ncbi:hypothetical protein Bca4012_012427 [Brassica carinata]
MEEERRSIKEESSHLWIPFEFLNEVIKSFIKCLGLQISPSPSYSSVSSVIKLLAKKVKEIKGIFLLFYIDLIKLDVRICSNKKFTNACRRLQTT